MGYTHYFEHKEVTQKVWDLIKTDCKKLADNLPDNVKINGCNMSKDPQFTKDMILFNGISDNSHETFILNREGSKGFTFCKTAYKPYDLLVCACLLVYRYHSQETIDLGSDGNNEDWQPASKFIKSVLNYNLKYQG